jgi:hypothetical protein
VRISPIRILTALAVIAVCLLALVRGWDIVRFSVAQAEIGTTPEPEAFRPWVDVPGLAFLARDASLTAIADQREDGQNAKLLGALSEILSVKPVAAGYWLSLAKLRFGSEQASDKVMETWSLSVLTGPNEGNVLPWRGIFGLSLWDGASSEVKGRTIADLAASLPEFRGPQQAAARVLLSAKTETSRQEIRSRLLAEGTSEDRLAAIGL